MCTAHRSQSTHLPNSHFLTDRRWKEDGDGLELAVSEASNERDRWTFVLAGLPKQVVPAIQWELG